MLRRPVQLTLESMLDALESRSRANRSPGAGSSARGAFLVSLLMLTGSGCSFHAPAYPPSAVDAGLGGDAISGMDDAQGLDATSPDLGQGDDATSPDAPAEDAGVSDLGFADAGFADAGFVDAGFDGGASDLGFFPDALPTDTGIPPDSGAPDAGFAPDAQPDAGPPDSGISPDAGFPSCTLPGAWSSLGATPSSLGTITLPFNVDLPLLAADLDGDGQDELIALSIVAATAAVIDFDDCTSTPQIVAQSSLLGTVATGAAVVSPNTGGRAVVSGSGNQLSLLFYDRVARTFEPTPPSTANVDMLRSVATTPLGDVLFLLGQHQGMGMWGQMPGGSRSLPGVPRQTGAYLGSTGGNYSWVVTTDLDVRVVSVPGDVVLPQSGTPVGPPSLLGAGGYGGADTVHLAYSVLDSTTRGLRVVRFSAANPTATAVSVTFMTGSSDVLAAPLVAWSPSATGFYFLTSDGRLDGCTLIPGNLVCTRPTGTPYNLPGGAGAVRNNSELLSAYVRGPNPDLIAVSARGAVHFVGTNLTAFQTLTLQDNAVVAPSALIPHFFDRYGQPGTLLAVPLRNGVVELVGWRRPAGAGPDTQLWTQSRGRPERTGRLGP